MFPILRKSQKMHFEKISIKIDFTVLDIEGIFIKMFDYSRVCFVEH